MKNKISLWKDVMSNANKGPKANTDERVILENNKIMGAAYLVLASVFVIFCILFDTFNLQIRTWHIFSIIGITSYISFIILCKKAIIKDNYSSITMFMWGFITLPFSILNILLPIMKNGYLMIIALIILCIFVPLIMYYMAQKIYIKSL